MRYLRSLCAVCLLVVSPAAYPQQISPNPNPVGNTIKVDTGDANNADPFTNDGKILIYNGSGLTNDSTLLNNWLLNNIGTLNNDGILKNDGMLNNDGWLFNYRTLNNVGTLNNYRALNNVGTLDNDGTIDTTNGTFYNYGTKTGSGHIIGSYSDYGVTKPGNSAGAMTIDGNYFKRGGSIEIELGGLLDGGGDKSATQFDWIDVTGNVELAGTLDV